MTQKEIDKFLANTKVYVNGKSREIQEKLFSLGYCWRIGVSTEVKCEKDPFIFIYKEYSISCTNDMRTFTRSEYREITAEEILSLELTEPDYRPFKNAEECWQEMLKHEPFGWVIVSSLNEYRFIRTVGKDLDYTLMFDIYIFTDGTPFGVKEE